MGVVMGWSTPAAAPSPQPPTATVPAADTTARKHAEHAEHADDGEQFEHDAPTSTALDAAAHVTIAAPAVPPRSPTRERFAHLSAIRARLSPAEQAIAQNTISRMQPQMFADWLAALAAMSVDEATTLIRRMVADIQRPRGSKPRSPMP